MTHEPDPDETDEFTARLRAQTLAELPAHWRIQILAAASNQSRSPDRPSRWHRATGKFGEWLWPHPLAYAGLAAAWAFILAIRLATATPQPASSSPAAGLVTKGERTTPENGLPLFESIRLASRESSWNPNVAIQP